MFELVRVIVIVINVLIPAYAIFFHRVPVVKKLQNLSNSVITIRSIYTIQCAPMRNLWRKTPGRLCNDRLITERQSVLLGQKATTGIQSDREPFPVQAPKSLHKTASIASVTLVLNGILRSKRAHSEGTKNKQRS
jgi:hypothetical protein